MGVTYPDYSVISGKPREIYSYTDAVLFVTNEQHQVMSDVWERWNHVHVWDESLKKAIEIQNPTSYTIDATPTVVVKYIKWKVTQEYNNRYQHFLEETLREAKTVRVGVKVRVCSGSKHRQFVGQNLQVFAIAEMPYNTGWNSNWNSKLERKAGLALTDRMGPRVGKNGKTYNSHLDTVWVWARHLAVIDVDAPALAAYSRQKAEEDATREKIRLINQFKQQERL